MLCCFFYLKIAENMQLHICFSYKYFGRKECCTALLSKHCNWSKLLLCVIATTFIFLKTFDHGTRKYNLKSKSFDQEKQMVKKSARGLSECLDFRKKQFEKVNPHILQGPFVPPKENREILVNHNGLKSFLKQNSQKKSKRYL